MDLYIFDFDDTIAITDSRIKVIRNGEEILMTSREFADFPVDMSTDQIDFGDFHRVEGTLIKETVREMEKAKAYFDVKRNFKTMNHSKELNGLNKDSKLESDVKLEQPDEEVHPKLDDVIKITASKQNTLLPESHLEEALDELENK